MQPTIDNINDYIEKYKKRSDDKSKQIVKNLEALKTAIIKRQTEGVQYLDTETGTIRRLKVDEFSNIIKET
jgi:ABC-type lipopolysaccharide export system ATPase subunit